MQSKYKITVGIASTNSYIQFLKYNFDDRALISEPQIYYIKLKNSMVATSNDDGEIKIVGSGQQKTCEIYLSDEFSYIRFASANINSKSNKFYYLPGFEQHYREIQGEGSGPSFIIETLDPKYDYQIGIENASNNNTLDKYGINDIIATVPKDNHITNKMLTYGNKYKNMSFICNNHKVENEKRRLFNVLDSAYWDWLLNNRYTAENDVVFSLPENHGKTLPDKATTELGTQFLNISDNNLYELQVIWNKKEHLVDIITRRTQVYSPIDNGIYYETATKKVIKYTRPYPSSGYTGVDLYIVENMGNELPTDFNEGDRYILESNQDVYFAEREGVVIEESYSFNEPIEKNGYVTFSPPLSETSPRDGGRIFMCNSQTGSPLDFTKKTKTASVDPDPNQYTRGDFFYDLRYDSNQKTLQVFRINCRNHSIYDQVPYNPTTGKAEGSSTDNPIYNGRIFNGGKDDPKKNSFINKSEYCLDENNIFFKTFYNVPSVIGADIQGAGGDGGKNGKEQESRPGGGGAGGFLRCLIDFTKFPRYIIFMEGNGHNNDADVKPGNNKNGSIEPHLSCRIFYPDENQSSWNELIRVQYGATGGANSDSDDYDGKYGKGGKVTINNDGWQTYGGSDADYDSVNNFITESGFKAIQVYYGKDGCTNQDNRSETHTNQHTINFSKTDTYCTLYESPLNLVRKYTISEDNGPYQEQSNGGEHGRIGRDHSHDSLGGQAGGASALGYGQRGTDADYLLNDEYDSNFGYSFGGGGGSAGCYADGSQPHTGSTTSSLGGQAGAIILYGDSFIDLDDSKLAQFKKDVDAQLNN